MRANKPLINIINVAIIGESNCFHKIVLSLTSLSGSVFNYKSNISVERNNQSEWNFCFVNVQHFEAWMS